MTEDRDVLFQVTGLLEKAGIAYMVSGSVAMNYYAMPRMTRDIDIVVDLRIRDAERIATALESSFFVDVDAAKEAIRGRRMFNALHKETFIKVDFIVLKETPFQEVEFERRQVANVEEGMNFWIATPEDLLLSKLWWARDSRSEMQLKDVRNLIDSVAMDQNYLNHWALALGVTKLLDEVRK